MMKTLATFDINAGEGNCRNSEGAFVTLKNNRILFIHTRYQAGSGRDHDTADLAAWHSDDGGLTWTSDGVVIPHDDGALNYMSVSLLRLQNNRILLLFLRKSANGDGSVACMPYRCFSDDEGASWTAPERCLKEQDACYLVVNNDRLVQLPDGRVAFAAAITLRLWQKDHSAFGPAVCSFCCSDDNGETWSQTPNLIYPITGSGSRTGWQEPGIVSLGPNTLMMWLRNSLGYQYQSFSYDGGASWTQAAPNLFFRSPEAPLSMKRDPSDNSIVAVWDDHAPVWGTELRHDDKTHLPFWGTDRRPLVFARSIDNAASWTEHQILENDPDSGFCYTAIHFVGNRTLLAYCCGSKANGHGCLQDLRIRTLERE